MQLFALLSDAVEKFAHLLLEEAPLLLPLTPSSTLLSHCGQPEELVPPDA
jgi:hypothetical protein